MNDLSVKHRQTALLRRRIQNLMNSSAMSQNLDCRGQGGVDGWRSLMLALSGRPRMHVMDEVGGKDADNPRGCASRSSVMSRLVVMNHPKV
jgi:hypothetical protein